MNRLQAENTRKVLQAQGFDASTTDLDANADYYAVIVETPEGIGTDKMSVLLDLIATDQLDARELDGGARMELR